MDIVIYTAFPEETLALLAERGINPEPPCRRHPDEWQDTFYCRLAIRPLEKDAPVSRPVPGVYLGASRDEVPQGRIVMPDGFAIVISDPVAECGFVPDTGSDWWLLPELRRHAARIRQAMNRGGFANARVIAPQKAGELSNRFAWPLPAGRWFHMIVDAPEGADLAELNSVLASTTDPLIAGLEIRSIVASAIPDEAKLAVDLSSTWLDEILPNWSD